MGLFDKVKGAWDSSMKKAAEKLSYSEEDIAERMKKEGIVYVFDGGNGSLLEVYEDRVILYHNKSLFGKFAAFLEHTVGEKTLYASDISSVEFKEAQKLCIGYIRFSLLNGANDRRSTADAADDPNAVAIAGVEKNAKAAEISQYISGMLAKVRNKGTTSVVMQSSSSADELKKFKELLDAGVITQDEFDVKKKQLLGLN